MIASRDYIDNPKGLRSSFMTMAFESVEQNRGDFVSAMHPADKTVRPQIVKQVDNPNYHGLLKEFEKLTGRGVLLNTSFNLHGMPVVLGPKEAIFTLLNSGLDGLVMEDVLVLRKVRFTTVRHEVSTETIDARVQRPQKTLGGSRFVSGLRSDCIQLGRLTVCRRAALLFWAPDKPDELRRYQALLGCTLRQGRRPRH